MAKTANLNNVRIASALLKKILRWFSSKTVETTC